MPERRLILVAEVAFQPFVRDRGHPGRKAPDEQRLNVFLREQSAEVSHKFNWELLEGRLPAFRWRGDDRRVRDGWFRVGNGYPEP